MLDGHETIVCYNSIFFKVVLNLSQPKPSQQRLDWEAFRKEEAPRSAQNGRVLIELGKSKLTVEKLQTFWETS